MSQPPIHVPERPVTKWLMLGIVFAGLLAMTVNWFNISTGFPAIGAEFDLAIPEVAFLISIFVAAYGLLHIPGGFLATRWGLRRTLAAGLALEGIGALMSAGAQSFTQLVITRAVAGAGASIFAAVGIAAVSIWFRDRHHGVALGISAAGFSVGTALGLYVWADITHATSWRISLILGAVFCFVVCVLTAIFFRTPRGVDTLSGVRLDTRVVWKTLSNRSVVLFGLAFFGAYGAFLAASQLLAEYGAASGVGSGAISLAAFLIGVAGVPGAITAGWLGDRLVSPRKLFAVGAMLEAAFLVLVPFTGPATFWIPAAGIGFMFNFTFAAWQTVPGSIRSINPEHIGTAIGLMLSISAIGGFVLPWAYGVIVERSGYTAGWTVLGVISALTVGACLANRSSMTPTSRSASGPAAAQTAAKP